MSTNGPTCGHKLTSAKSTVQVDKRILQDQAKAAAAILALDRACTNPFFVTCHNPDWKTRDANPTVIDTGMLQAISDERRRLARAITDHKLLWSLYRRSDKKAPYYV